jgi:hypothetical protein
VDDEQVGLDLTQCVAGSPGREFALPAEVPYCLAVELMGNAREMHGKRQTKGKNSNDEDKASVFSTRSEVHSAYCFIR